MRIVGIAEDIGEIKQADRKEMVQWVVVTDDRRHAAEELASRWTQLSPAEILQSPYVLIGTVDQMVEDLQVRRERLGISYYVIFEPYMICVGGTGGFAKRVYCQEAGKRTEERGAHRNGSTRSGGPCGSFTKAAIRGPSRPGDR